MDLTTHGILLCHNHISNFIITSNSINYRHISQLHHHPTLQPEGSTSTHPTSIPNTHHPPKMSSTTTPIPLPRFTHALKSLPISALYAKSRELHNSLAHLRASNTQLHSYITSTGPDTDLTSAIQENEDTMQRMEARILAVEYEVVVERGLPWSEEEGGKELGKGVGDGGQRERNGSEISTRPHTGETNGGGGGMFL
jgi:hypothetical protein